MTNLGYRGTETSRAEAIIYSRGSEVASPQKRTFQGRDDQTSGAVVTAINTSKKLGVAAGTFNIDVKVYERSKAVFLDTILDDDWVDIIMYRFNVPFLVLRGLVDDVRRYETVTGNGASSLTYRISGRDFGKIFEDTAFYYDRVSTGIGMPAATSRMWSQHKSFTLTRPDETVWRMLTSFLQPANNTGAALWRLPDSLSVPNTTNNEGGDPRSFINKIFPYTADFDKVIPKRGAPIIPIQFSTSAPNVWSLGQEWSDPLLTEVIPDLITRDFHRIKALDGYLKENESTDPRNGGSPNMSVIIRDRPFPTAVRTGTLVDSPYFKRIPLFTAQREDIFQMDVGRSGRMRKNVFITTPMLQPSQHGSFYFLNVPLINRESVKDHGVRKLEITTRYLPLNSLNLASENDDESIVNTMLDYQSILRDYHCLNHLYLNGSIRLTHGRPDIRVGGRFRVAGRTEDEDTTFYIESVEHSWTYEMGLRTSMQVSHGWIGSDLSLISALDDERAKYELSDVSSPGNISSGESAQPIEEVVPLGTIA